MWLLVIASGFVSMCFFFFNDTATTEIYTLSLHDALPIYGFDVCRRMKGNPLNHELPIVLIKSSPQPVDVAAIDRKSTRLNSSHSQISYAVFCLKKKKNRLTLET